jgi:hypothetical protein
MFEAGRTMTVTIAVSTGIVRPESHAGVKTVSYLPNVCACPPLGRTGKARPASVTPIQADLKTRLETNEAVHTSRIKKSSLAPSGAAAGQRDDPRARSEHSIVGLLRDVREGARGIGQRQWYQ